MARVLSVDAEQAERAKRFYRAMLDRALDDVRRILAGAEVLDVIDPDAAEPRLRVLSHAECQEVLDETLDWFFDRTLSECSLETVCDVLGLDAGAIRRGVREIVRGYRPIRLRRRNVSLAARLYVMDSLDRGATPQEIAREIGTDDSTIRKIRIKRRAGRYGADGRLTDPKRSPGRPRKDQAAVRA